VKVVKYIFRGYRRVLDYGKLRELDGVPFRLHLEYLAHTLVYHLLGIAKTSYQGRTLLSAISTLARILLVILHPVLARRRLRKAILSLSMGPLLPHLRYSASRRGFAARSIREDTLTRLDLEHAVCDRRVVRNLRRGR
jgi:hypothetical protein